MGYFPFRITALCLLAAASSARADTLALDLTSTASFDRAASSGMWNTLQGRLQAPYAGGGAAGKEVDFGDGSDGVFADGPTQTGITVTGVNVIIDTDVKSSYQFTSFTLSAGHTITIQGANPLVLRVYGAVAIGGSVSTDGGSGSDNGSFGTGNQINGLISGGSGIGGGGSGGNGGQSDGTQPLGGNPPAGAASRGGGAGTNATGTGADNGGGGGCNDNVGATAAPAGGTAGSCSAASVIAGNFETTFIGGAGGGGGGGCTTANGTCPAMVGGAAGGAGGGAIRISALGSLTVTGTLSAKGGGGGENNADNSPPLTGDCGGGGGGGSGGSVWLQSASAISGAGAVDVSHGSGGIASSGDCFGAGYDGGDGSDGIFRADAPAVTLGTPHPAANNLNIPSGATYEIVSKAFDLSAGYFSLSSATETKACGGTGTLTVFYEGSDDGTTWNKSVQKADLAQLANTPYLRFRTRIATTGSSPPCLTALSVEYGRSELANLSLQGSPFLCGTLSGDGGGGRRGARDSANGHHLPLMLGDLSILALAVWLARRMKTPPPARASGEFAGM